MNSNWRGHLLAVGLLTGLGLTWSADRVPLLAQAPTDVADLRRALERQFDILPLQDGVVLRPRTRTGTLRSIEVHSGSVAVDGQVMTGAELRDRLGANADLVIQVSFLSPPDQRALAGVQEPAATASPNVAVPGVAAAESAREARDRAREAAREARNAAREARDRARERMREAFGRRGGRDGDRVRFGGSVTVNEGETVDGDVVVFGGTARIMGRVDGDVVVIGGSANLGPKAEVTNDLVVIGGRLNRDAAAQVGGEVQEVGIGPFSIFGGNSPRIDRSWNWSWDQLNPFRGVSSLVMTTVRTGVLCLLTALVLLLAGGFVDQIRGLAAAQPIKAGAVGFLSQVLAVPLVVVITIVLVITIVGIPFLLLMPFVFLALALLALVGFTAVARQVGGFATGRFGAGGVGDYVATLIGVVVILSPLLVARLMGVAGGPMWLVSTPLALVGYCSEYVAWTIGMGAVLSALAGLRAPVTPPPLPQS